MVLGAGQTKRFLFKTNIKRCCLSNHKCISSCFEANLAFKTAKLVGCILFHSHYTQMTAEASPHLQSTVMQNYCWFLNFISSADHQMFSLSRTQIFGGEGNGYFYQSSFIFQCFFPPPEALIIFVGTAIIYRTRRKNAKGKI